MSSEVVNNTYGVELPTRYEIRRLGPELEPWLREFARYTSVLETPVFGPAYKDLQPVKMLLEMHAKNIAKPGMVFALKSGLSYGIFDKEYQFKRPESVATGGAVYWDEIDVDDPDLEVTGPQRLLDAMDFPLVAISMSHDKADPMPAEAFQENIDFMPKYADLITIFKTAQAANPQPEDESKETKPGEVLQRCGTTTRKDYAGRGLMKLLAQFTMHDAHTRGFKAIDISVIHDGVAKVYLNPPAPYHAEVKQFVDIKASEIEVDGTKVRPFPEAKSKGYYAITVHLDS